jgi:glucokinase
MSGSKHTVIGIDVGGTKIAAGLLALPGGDPLGRRVIPTNSMRGGQAVLDDVVSLARDLTAEAASLALNIDAVGLGICELVDREGRIKSANCIHWTELPVREMLFSIAPAVIEADVRAAALAEALFGAGKPFRNFLYITIGTGISCCLMLDGAPYLGAHGATGTMASSPLTLPCEACAHVSQRSLEEIAAGPALVARYRKAGGTANTGKEILAAATAGDAAAQDIIESATAALGSQAGLLVNVLDPEAIIIGGGFGLGLSEGPYWDHLIGATRQNIWSSAHRDLPILRAGTGKDAGWMGTAASAWQHFKATSLTTKPYTQS